MYFAVHHVQLACPAGSEAVARSFYVDVLGLSELVKPLRLAARGGCWFRGPGTDGGIEFHIGVEPDFRPARKAHPGIVWGDTAALRVLSRRLSEAGYEVSWDDELTAVAMKRGGSDPYPSHPDGMERFYVHDPHGNRLEFMAPIE